MNKWASEWVSKKRANENNMKARTNEANRTTKRPYMNVFNKVKHKELLHNNITVTSIIMK